MNQQPQNHFDHTTRFSKVKMDNPMRKHKNSNIIHQAVFQDSTHYGIVTHHLVKENAKLKQFSCQWNNVGNQIQT